MPITFPCRDRNCDHVFRVADTSVGKRVKCPSCGRIQPVPATPTEQPPPALDHPPRPFRAALAGFVVVGSIGFFVLLGAFALSTRPSGIPRDNRFATGLMPAPVPASLRIPRTEWHEFAPDGWRCKALLPGVPQAVPWQDSSIQGGKYALERKAEGLSFAVSYLDLPGNLEGMEMMLTLAQRERDRLVAALQGTVVYERQLAVAVTVNEHVSVGFQGKDCQVVSADRGGKIIERIWFVPQGQICRFFIVSVAGPADIDLQGGDAGLFFESCKPILPPDFKP